MLNSAYLLFKVCVSVALQFLHKRQALLVSFTTGLYLRIVQIVEWSDFPSMTKVFL